MKERIRELMLKADRETLCHTDDGSPYLVREFDVEKFAELIIRDVVKTVKRTQNTSSDFEWAILNNYDLEIKQ